MTAQCRIEDKDQCPNYEVNVADCPCTSENCARRGLCCQCVAAHRAGGGKVACMR